jgi:hypothetical protein
MFGGGIIAVAFILIFLCIPVVSIAERKGALRVEKAALSVGLAAAVYCIAAAIYLYPAWQDPLAAAEADQLARASASGGGRGGVVVAAIRYWPLFLGGIGAYFGYHNARILGLIPSKG